MFSRLEWSWLRCGATQCCARPPQVNSLSTSPWYKAFTGMVPFNDRTSPAAITAIIRGKRPPRPTHPSLTDRLWELVNQCWHQDQDNRPRMLEVLLALNPLIHECTRLSGPPPVAAGMRPLVSDVQRRLENLNPSNEDYRPLVSALLSHRDLKPHIDSLQKGDLAGFIELLDRVCKTDIHNCWG